MVHTTCNPSKTLFSIVRYTTLRQPFQDPLDQTCARILGLVISMQQNSVSIPSQSFTYLMSVRNENGVSMNSYEKRVGITGLQSSWT